MSVSFGNAASTDVGPVENSPAVYFGATDGSGNPHFQKIAGRQVSVMNKFSRWSGDSAADFLDFPRSWVESVDAQGVIPMLTWNPTYIDKESCARYRSLCGYDLKKIAEGSYDDYIKKFAGEVKAAGIPIFLRTMHEANGDWYPWNVQKGSSRSSYIAAWRHIHDIFRETGANNVTWVWCPNVKRTSGATANVPLSSFYPGDDYVDWIGLDGYNRGTNMSFSAIFETSLKQVSSFSKKPIMIAELGTASFRSSTTRSNFLTKTYAIDLPKKFPQIRAILYFMNTKDVDLSRDVKSSKALAQAVSGGYYAGPHLANIVDAKIEPLRHEDAISVLTPPHPEGVVRVTVTNSSGEAVVASQTFTYRDPAAEIARLVGTSALAAVGFLILLAVASFIPMVRRRAEKIMEWTSVNPRGGTLCD
nr:glycosyl hydrolase [Microbacterium sp. ru370.1]